MKINIRESLGKLDLLTDNKYDLRNTYDASKVSNLTKNRLAEALNEKASAEKINRILNENFAINVFPRDSEEYEKLEKVADYLTNYSPNNIYYRVEKTYFDFGQDWMWTTIIAYDKKGNSWQAIYPKVQEDILLANSDEELEEIAKKFLRESRLDKGFSESLTEASYGGAYDIEDDMYFTKEELVEFADEFIEKFSDWSEHRCDLEDLYMDNPKHLIVDIYDHDDDVTHRAEINIDMRKIRTPKSIYRYGDSLLKQWKDSYLEYHEYDESLNENKKVGSNKLSQGMGLPGKNFELVKVVDGVVSSKDRYECRIYSKELDSNYKTYGFYQGEVIFSEDYDPQLIDSVFPDEGTKVKLAIYRVPEDDPDHDWTGDYFVDYIDETNESLTEANSIFTVELYTNKNEDPSRFRFKSYEEAMKFAKKKSNTGIYEIIMITKPDASGPSVVNSFDINDGWFKESLTEEVEEELYKVVLKYGPTKLDFMTGLSEKDAEEIIDTYGSRWIDENGYEWDMEIEEDEESTERVYPFDESLNEAYEYLYNQPFLKTFDEFVSKVSGLKADELDDEVWNEYFYEYQVYNEKYKVKDFENKLRKSLEEKGLEVISIEPSEIATLVTVKFDSVEKKFRFRFRLFDVNEETEEYYIHYIVSMIAGYFGLNESLKESIDISDYEELHYPLRDGDKYYQLYRKIENGKGVWAAAELDKYGSDVIGEPFRITYEQARGFEPIEDSSIRKLSRDLGKKLLPKRENLKEQINLPGYAVKYVTGYAGNGVNSSETEWFRTEEERDRRVEELKDNNYIGIKTWKMDGFYHTLPKNESLTEGIEDLDSISSTKAKDMSDADFKVLKPLVDEYLKDRKALGDWPDSVDERNFVKKWYKLADKCKEIAKNGSQGITGYGRLNDFIKIKILELARSVDNTFLWYTRNNLAKFNELESLQEKLNNREKNVFIDKIEKAKSLYEIEDTIKDIRVYDLKLYSKLVHYPNDFEKAKNYVLKILKNSMLKEDYDDEVDLDYETDFDDDGVEEGTNFIEDGTEWVWVERVAGPIHLDFDNWAVWAAREYVDPRDFITMHDNGKGYDFDGDGFKKKAMAAPVNYFVVDEDTGFIDWGPVETQTEAQDFLNGKVEDWEKDESLQESKELKEWYTHTLHYEDIGDGREYDYEVDHEDLLDYILEIAIDEDDAPEDAEEYMDWVEDNFDELFKKYEYDILNHFEEDASQEEYDKRHEPYE